MPVDYPRCPDCREKIINRGAHLERCPGPMQRIADPPAREPDCGCPPGMRHQRGCELAYWHDDGDEAA